MRTIILPLLTSLLLLATSCMPDSLTKFKEEPPKLKGDINDTDDQGGSVATPTPTPTPVPLLDYTINSAKILFSQGDIWLVKVADGRGFGIGDYVGTSTGFIVADPQQYENFGIVVANHRENGETGNARWLAIALSEAIDFDTTDDILDFDNAALTSFDEDDYEVLNGAFPVPLGNNYEIEGYGSSCSGTQYGLCPLGTFTKTTIVSEPVLYIPPTGIAEPDLNLAQLNIDHGLSLSENIDKKIHIEGSSTTGDEAKSMTWNYTFSPVLPVLGTSASGLQSDRLISQISSAYNENDTDFITNPMEVTVTSVDNLSATTTFDLYWTSYIPGSPAKTTLASMAFDQYEGDKLIIKVDDISSFSTTSGLNKISNRNGASGRITFIDELNNRLFIVVDDDDNPTSDTNGNFLELEGSKVFKGGDNLDNAQTFVATRATVSADPDSVVHVFDLSTPRFNGTGFAPRVYDADGNEVSSGTLSGEGATFAITPVIPDGLDFSTTTGAIDKTVADGDPLATLESTTFTLSVRNSTEDPISLNYTISIAEPLSLPSIGRYQFVRLSSNNSKFYAGTRYSAQNSAGQDPKSGRVLMPINTNEDTQMDGMLVEGNGLLSPGVRMDNTTEFYASEGFVLNYELWFVDDTSDFEIGDQVETNSNDVATILAIEANINRLYVVVNSGEFSIGEVIKNRTNDTERTFIKSVARNQFVTGIVEIVIDSDGDGEDDTGDSTIKSWRDIIVGEKMTFGAAGEFLVVQKHLERRRSLATTTLAGESDDPTTTDVNESIYDPDARYYLLIQHVKNDSGASAMPVQGDNLVSLNATQPNLKVRRVVGPIVDVAIDNSQADTSSQRKDVNGDALFSGSMVGQFNSSHKFTSVGFAIDGTHELKSGAASNIRVLVENFSEHFAMNTGNTNYLDDFSVSTSSASKARVQGVTLSNNIVGYVGKELYIESFINGEVGLYRIEPTTLPTGLTFDSLTGTISGTPTETLDKRNYQIFFVGTDGDDSTSYSFDMMVYNIFEISHATENAGSFHIHSEGQGLGGSYCRVLSNQVIDDVGDPNYGQAIYGQNDIVCIMEANEAELFNQGINFETNVGNGMCEFVQHIPFSYQSIFPGKQASKNSRDYTRIVTTYTLNNPSINGDDCDVALDFATVDNSVIPASEPGILLTEGVTGDNHVYQHTGDGTIVWEWGKTYCESNEGSDCIPFTEASNTCSYDYSVLDPDLPNMDSGRIIDRRVSCVFTPNEDGDDTCSCNVTRSVIDCGGDNAISALGGAKLDSGIDIDSQVSKITPIPGGGVENYTYPSPISKGFGTNRHLANYISHHMYADSNDAANSCYANPYHMDTYSAPGSLTTNRSDWGDYSNRRDPFGIASQNGLYSNYYVFNCLDAAEELKARVRVVVRDWDREFVPSDHEVTNLWARPVGDSSSPAANASRVRSGAATTNSDQVVIQNVPNDFVFGPGTKVYLESHTTTTDPEFKHFDDSLDTRYFTVAYIISEAVGASTTNYTVKLFANMSIGANTPLYIRSNSQEIGQSTFGIDYDGRRDHDSLATGTVTLNGDTLTSLIRDTDSSVQFASCATPDTPESSLTINIEAGSYFGRIPNASGSMFVTRGQMMAIGDSTFSFPGVADPNVDISSGQVFEDIFETMVLNSGSCSDTPADLCIQFASPAPYTATGQEYKIFRSLPYPIYIN